MSDNNSKLIRADAPPRGSLGRSELWAVGAGQAIGSGVLTLIGPALLLTGQSVWLAYITAVLWGFLIISPNIWVSSMFRMAGGNLSLVSGSSNLKVAGMYACTCLTGTIGLSSYGVAVGMYAQSIWPSLNATLVGVAAMSLFLFTNLMGINFMAKLQKIMMYMLLGSLILFIVVGVMNIENPVFEFSAPNFFEGGAKGFWKAVFLFCYSTQGYSLITNYGKDAKNARKDIPLAILACVPVLAVIYGGVALADSAVLPLNEVAGQPLTYMARHLFPNLIFVIWMICGPGLALSTSMNSTISFSCIPIAQACEDGWFPKSWAAKNKNGAYWKLMIFTYLVGCIPVLAGYDISQVTSNIVLISLGQYILLYYVWYTLPNKFPDAWNKRTIKISKPFYYVAVTVSLIAWSCMQINAMSNVTTTALVISMLAIAACMIYGYVRSSSDGVKVRTSMWDYDGADPAETDD